MTDPLAFPEPAPAFNLPVPGLPWRPPYAGQSIHRDPETELRHGNDEHWYKVAGAPRSYPSVTTILGLIDKSKALLGWHQRATLRALQDNLLNILANPERFHGRQDLPRLLEDLTSRAAQDTALSRRRSGVRIPYALPTLYPVLRLFPARLPGGVFLLRR